MNKAIVLVLSLTLSACSAGGGDTDDAPPSEQRNLPALPSNVLISVAAPDWEPTQDASGMLLRATDRGFGEYDLQGQAELARPAHSSCTVKAGNFLCASGVTTCPRAPTVIAENLLGGGLKPSAPIPYISNDLLICGYTFDQRAFLHANGPAET